MYLFVLQEYSKIAWPFTLTFMCLLSTEWPRLVIPKQGLAHISPAELLWDDRVGVEQLLGRLQGNKEDNEESKCRKGERVV